MKKKDIKDCIEQYMRLSLMVFFPIAIIAIVKAVMNGPPSRGHVWDVYDSIVLTSLLSLTYTYLLLLPIVQDRMWPRQILDIKNMVGYMIGDFEKRDFLKSTVMGATLIGFPLTAIILLSRDIQTALGLFLFFIFFVVSGIEYIVFGVVYFRRDHKRVSTGVLCGGK